MTDKLREAAQQALEALDNMTDSQSNPARRNFPTIHDYGKSRRAADALRAALAQQDAQAALQGWRSMDTAPLGVTAFFWIKWSDVPVIGEWDGKSLSANHEHLDVSCGAYCYGGSVCTAGHTEPTHWMPLPPAPDAAPHAAPTPPAQGMPVVCQGTNCGAADGQDHSPECIVETAEAQGWGDAPEVVAARQLLNAAPTPTAQEKQS